MKTRHNHKWEYILLLAAYIIMAICQVPLILVTESIFWTIIHAACGVMFMYLAVKEITCFVKEKDHFAEENAKKNKIMIVVTVLMSVVAVTMLFIISIPLVNDISADAVRKELAGIELPEKTELVESVSRAEKLVGNGNGMQYLGAILIESELGLDELKAHYVGYEIDEAADFIHKIGVIFDADLSKSENYYVTYGWGKGIEPFASLDLRGH